MEENDFYQQKKVPHDPHAEQSVIGSMLRSDKCIPQVIDALKPDDFYIKVNQDIFKVIYSLFSLSKEIDPLLIKDEMKLLGEYDDDYMFNYLKQLLSSNPTSANLIPHISILQDKTLLRNLNTISGELFGLVQDGRERGENVLAVAEQRIDALRSGNSFKGLVGMERVLGEVQEEINESAMKDSSISGISTGLGDLDRVLSGLGEGHLILLAARPGMGKTSMALNMLLHAGKYSKKNVAFFSLEMSRLQLGMRLVSSESFVDNKKLTSGQLNDIEFNNVMEACSSLVQAKILIDEDSMVTVADIKGRCKRVPDLGLIIIDYLQLMSSAGGKSGGGENRQQVVSDISRNLKLLANELEVPVVCLSQLSRASEKRENKRPILSDLRESGAIEQDADIVMFLYREDYYDNDTENHNIAECIIAKNRHGETGTVELEWIPQFTTFRGIERRLQEQ